jgi:pyridoxine kinase
MSAVVLVNSLVARGAVGGRAGLFALTRRGHDVWFVPTVLLPWHPGHGRASRAAVADADCAALLGDLAASPRLGEVAAVITGYFVSPAQVEAAARFVAAAKAARPDLLYLCDPVMGDVRPDGAGGLYVPEATAAAIAGHLLPLADVMTPNLFELGYLSGRPLATTPAEAIAAARALGRPTVVVTSAPALMRDAAATLLVEADDATAAEHPRLAGAPNGTGDLLAALFVAERLAGNGNARALERAAAATFDMAARAVRAGRDELPLAAEHDILATSLASVTMRRIGDARPVRPPPRRPVAPSSSTPG